jgi:hypothetical protein
MVESLPLIIEVVFSSYAGSWGRRQQMVIEIYGVS